MALIDLKRPKPPKEKKSEDKGMPATVGPSYEERPYCLRFTLEKPELDKLGLDPSAFSGMEPITATVVIDPITIRDNESKTQNRYDENSNQSVEFQVIKIEIGEMKAKAPSKYAGYKAQKEQGPE